MNTELHVLPRAVSAGALAQISSKLVSDRLRRICAFVALAAAATLSVSAAPATFFGSCAADNADLTGANLKITRFTLNWSAIQPTAGSGFNFAAEPDATDAVVGALLDNGKDVLLVAGSKWPAWTGTQSGTTDDPPTAAQVAAFAKAAAQHYYGLRNKKIYLEIVNEPNGNIGSDAASATLYKNMLAQSKTAIRSVLTVNQVAIVGVVLAGTPWMNNANDVDTFWTGITTGTNPVQNNMDILSYHLYTMPPIGQADTPPEVGNDRGGPLMDRLVNSKALIDGIGFTGPVWATEGGFPTQDGEKNKVTEAQQARWLVRMAVVMRGFGLGRFIQFKFQDSGVLFYGLVDSGNSPKPSYNAYKTMCTVLDSAVNGLTKQLYDSGANRVCRYNYTKTNGDYGYVVWTINEGSSATVGVSVGTNGDIWTRGLTDNVWTHVGVRSGTFNVAAGPNPTYVEVR